MRFFAVALALASTALAVPTGLKAIQKFNGEVKPNSFIITLKPGTSKSAHLSAFRSNFGKASTSEITHSEWDEGFFNGFAGETIVSEE
jgi:cerevisin